jgi:hypothetical protein
MHNMRSNRSRAGAATMLAVVLSARGGGGVIPSPLPPLAPVGTLQLQSGTLTVAENAGTVSVVITRSGGTAGAVGISLTTSAGSASAGADFTSITTTVRFADGDAAPKTVSIPVLGDSIDELNESFTAALFNATGGATLGSITSTTITVTDDDPLHLVASMPADGATAVDRAGSIQLTFSTPIDAESAADMFAVDPQDIFGPITLSSLTASVSGAQVTLTSARPLLPLTRYGILTGAGIQNTAGEALGTDAYIAFFTTRDGQWQQAELIESGDAGSASPPRIAINQVGQAMAVWEESDVSSSRIWSSQYVAGWRTPQRLLPPSVNGGTTSLADPAVAVDGLANAMAVWALSRSPVSLVANRSNQDQWSLGEIIAGSAQGPVGQFPQIAMDRFGNAHAIWMQFTPVPGQPTSPRIWTKRYAAGQGWGVPTKLVDMGLRATNPQIGVDSLGNALAVWEQLSGSRTIILSSRYAAETQRWEDRTFDVVSNVDNALGNSFAVQITVGKSGNALAVWSQANGTRTNIWANRYLAQTHRWLQARMISTADGNQRSAGGPQVAIDASGNALAVWLQERGQGATSRLNIWANRYDARTDQWGTAELIEKDDSGSALHPQIAVDQRGNALAVWRQPIGTRENIWSNRYAAESGRWGTPELLETGDGGAHDPRVAVDGSGNALAIWRQFVGAEIKIWANRFE